MKALRTLIWGPRPLHPRLLKAFLQISSTPLNDYWRLLNGDYTLHVPSPKGVIVPLKLTSFSHLIHLLELKAFGIRLLWYETDKNILALDLYGDKFYVKPTGYSLEGILHMFRDKIYGDDFKGAYVIDIGAFTGDSAISFAKWGARKIIAVEPSPTSLEILRGNVGASRYKDKIEILPVAISDYDGYSTILTDEAYEGAHYLSDFNESLYYDEVFYFESKSSAQIEVWSFKHLLDYAGEEEIDVVKFDCKGCEYPIILNTDPDTLRRVNRYIIAYHAGPERLTQRLNQIGYEIHITAAAPGHEHLFPTAGTIFARKMK